MSRNPYCGGKPPSAWKVFSGAQSAGPVLSVFRAALWLMLLGIPLLPLSAVEKPPDCPEFKSLCVQASQSGGIDLKTGIAVLEGNVNGYLKTQDLSFVAQSLKAFRNDKKEWVRLVLDRKVRISQPDREVRADHAVLEHERMFLFGNGWVESQSYLITGNEIRLLDDVGRILAQGAGSDLTHIEYRTSYEDKPDTFLMDAQHAVIDEQRGEIQLTGKASVIRKELDWRVRGNSIRIELDNNNEIEFFRGEGAVVITQPGRTLRADTAISRNNNETILLVGNASIKKQGEFEISSDRLEVYMDAKKGVVQSEQRQKPIKLAFDLAESKPYQLKRSSLDELNGKGVPRITLDKLTPLLGRSFPGRKQFSAAARKLLTDPEAQRFLPTIVNHAK